MISLVYHPALVWILFANEVSYYLCIFVHRTVLTVFLFGVRGFATGFFQTIGLYTPEVTEAPTMYDDFIDCIYIY